MSTPNSTTAPQLITAERLESITAIIPAKSSLKGDLRADQGCDQGILIDGCLEGSVVIPTGGIIHIGPNGNVAGALIEADFIFIEGKVESKIIGRKGVELTGTSVVKGQVEYQGALNMHSLAKVRASIQYTGVEE